uniref:Phosphoribulokinase/uridine kinase domain-containing protein n=1 Tax=Ciona savignyi TaxID=51511 RepID=H2ZC51_CIOSA
MEDDLKDSEMDQLKQRHAVLIVEGILLFNQTLINDVADVRLFLTLPFHEAKRRRDLRVYEPPDVDGMFELLVWPMYVKHVAEIDGIHKLSGLQSKDEVFNTVLGDIRQAWATYGPASEGILTGF